MYDMLKSDPTYKYILVELTTPETCIPYFKRAPIARVAQTFPEIPEGVGS